MTTFVADAFTDRPLDARRRERLAARALRGASAFWFVVAAGGQLFFALYILVFYARAALQGHPERWNAVLHDGYVPGAAAHDATLVSHVVCAFLLTAGGVLQLVPAMRRRFPGFHRWLGRVYVVAAALGSVAGLLLTWTGAQVGDRSQQIAGSVDALLILAFAFLAFRHARVGRRELHRRAALRLFLAVNGGWFYRVGLLLWLAVNRGPVGFDPKTFTGPFLTFLSFAEYVVPLAVLELYLRAQRARAPRAQLAVAAGLSVATLAMTAGIVAAAAALWWPHL